MYKTQDVINRVDARRAPDKEDLIYLLGLKKEPDVAMLYDHADRVRKEQMGEGVLLRGLIEFSSYCRNNCDYCGLRCGNKNLTRYRLSGDSILEAVSVLVSYGLRTVVLQAGEDPQISPEWLAGIIRSIRDRFDIAVTLSVGEQDATTYALWKESGAGRYLLKIETTDPHRYECLTGRSFARRLRCLDTLRMLGYQVGSGIMVGLPGQTPESIASDLLFFKERNFDMIGIGPFIAHPQTPLAGFPLPSVRDVLNVIALTRIMTRNAHLPATTALGSLDRDYRLDGLKAGANVLMPNFTPTGVRRQYEIYPGKRCITEAQGACVGCMGKQLSSIGRQIDFSVGHSKKLPEYVPHIGEYQEGVKV